MLKPGPLIALTLIIFEVCLQGRIEFLSHIQPVIRLCIIMATPNSRFRSLDSDRDSSQKPDWWPSVSIQTCYE